MPLSDQQLEMWNSELEEASTEEILLWAWERFRPAIAMSSSFQTQSIPLLHILSKTVPEMEVIFLDTGFHFPETLAFRDQLQKDLGLRVRNTVPAISKAELFRRYGSAPFQTNPDLCCHLNKVLPMEEATRDLVALVSGVRRDQTKTRSNFKVLERREDGQLRVHPMLRWTKKDVWDYIDEHTLPYHPKFHEGYLSVGCAPCTRPVFGDQDERAGRWASQDKDECGLHTPVKVSGEDNHENK